MSVKTRERTTHQYKIISENVKKKQAIFCNCLLHDCRLKIGRQQDGQKLLKLFFQLIINFFLDELWCWTRYLKCVFCFLLSRREKIIFIGFFNQNIFRFFRGRGGKNGCFYPPPWTLTRRKTLMWLSVIAKFSILSIPN